MEKYGAALLAEALFLLAGVLILSFGDGQVAESGRWLAILAAGAIFLTLVAAFSDSCKANKTAPPRRR